MKTLFKGLMLALLFICFSQISNAENGNVTHRVMSCNIRVALDEDEEKGVGWSVRKDVCIEVIKSYKPDIICLQEVLRVQNEDLKYAFADYMIFGFDGPEMDKFRDGYHGIAKNPILFSKDRYEFVAAGNYWLSEAPLIAASQSWGTARARNCSWMRIRDKVSGKEFRVVNTHLDHVSKESREKQIGMILEECAQYDDGFPQIFTGDFNCDMTSEVVKMIKKNGWIDTHSQAHGAEMETGRSTHGFKGVNVKPGKNGRIDFIFSRGTIEGKASELVKDEIDGIYPSDHFFIYADITIN